MRIIASRPATACLCADGCSPYTSLLKAGSWPAHSRTAFLSDAGMTGGHGGIIGMSADSVMPKFLMGTPSRFEVCEERVRFQGVVVEIDGETGRALDIARVNIPAED